MTEFTIDDYDATPLTSHWQTMVRADVALDDYLLDMRAMCRLFQDEATEEDFERFEIEDDERDDEDAYEVFNGWVLEVNRARWIDAETGRPAELSRVELILGTGGPHVQVDIAFGTSGQAQRVELRRYWSESDYAVSTDPRALSVCFEFVAAFLDF